MNINIKAPDHIFGEITREGAIELPSEDKVLEIVKEFGSRIIGKELVLDDNNRSVISNMIKWMANDPSFPGDLNAGIGLIGPPGTGKTKLLEIMQAIIIAQKINFKQYYKGWNLLPLNYEIFNSSRLCYAFQQKGYDGLENFCNYAVVALDDLGAESIKTKHWGSELEVLEYILQRRYEKRKITLFTANLKPDQIVERYGDRIYSRMKDMATIFELGGSDRRGYSH